jgi:hypothetical protein
MAASTLALSVLVQLSASIALQKPRSAHAAAPGATAAAIAERVLERTSASVDTLIDRYVQSHMFDDDLTVADPVTGTYKEARDDSASAKYPTTLHDMVAQIQGKDRLRDRVGRKGDDRRGGSALAALVTGVLRFLRGRVGLTDTAAVAVLAGVLILAGPSLFLLSGMIVGGISKRNMNKVFKQRYGEDYTVDATIRRDDDEVAVEAPEDDDNDDDEDGDDDEDSTSGDDEDDD